MATVPGPISPAATAFDSTEPAPSVAPGPAEGRPKGPPVSRVAAPPSASAASTAPTGGDPRERFDARFQSGLQALRDGRAVEAARIFDALAGDGSVDGPRRADAAAWAARAHVAAGNTSRALEQAGAAASGGAWQDDEAALLLGEQAARRGETETARRWLTRAAGSGRPATRERARKALAALDR